MEFKGIMKDDGYWLNDLMDYGSLRKHAKRRGIDPLKYSLNQIKLMIAYAEGYSIGKSEATGVNPIEPPKPAEKEYKNIVLSLPESGCSKCLKVTEEELKAINFMVNNFLLDYTEVQISEVKDFEKISEKGVDKQPQPYYNKYIR